MNVNPELLRHIVEAMGLGLGVALILWLLRRFQPVRRVSASLLLAALMFGLYLVVDQTGLPGEATVRKVVLAAGILLAANAGVQLVDVLVWDTLVSRRRHMAVPRLLVDVFNFIALTIVALAVLSAVFQVELSALLVTSTVVSAVIGLALQDVLGNVIAGLALQLEQPFRVGDWVQFAGHQEGHVVQMNWRSLTIRTRDNHDVIFPNAYVARNEFSNYSRPSALQRLHAQVGVAYQHPPGIVKEVLSRAVAQVDGVCGEPAVEIYVKTFGDFAVYYDIRYWITDYVRAQHIQDAVMTHVWYALRRAHLTIPLPVREVTLRTLSDDHETRVRQQLRDQIFNVLRRLAVFAPLSDAQIEQLAQSAALHRFTSGEALVQQDDAGSSLFVVTAGRVRVDVRGSNGRPVTVAELGAGEFFGEMSLLTGEPRSASVIAVDETEVVEVDKAAFAAVLSADTGILEALSVALESRARKSAEQLATEAAMRPEQPPLPRTALLKRIRAFFGIDPG
jgi:small-conductance mechanosensitive channel/CRP-like cAMP-binding protein